MSPARKATGSPPAPWWWRSTTTPCGRNIVPPGRTCLRHGRVAERPDPALSLALRRADDSPMGGPAYDAYERYGHARFYNMAQCFMGDLMPGGAPAPIAAPCRDDQQQRSAPIRRSTTRAPITSARWPASSPRRRISTRSTRRRATAAPSRRDAGVILRALRARRRRRAARAAARRHRRRRRARPARSRRRSPRSRTEGSATRCR